MDRKLMDGLRVVLWSLGDAGGYSVEKIRGFSPKVKVEISGGQPYKCARVEAEELAIAIDAELQINHRVVRESLSGTYYEKEESRLADAERELESERFLHQQDHKLADQWQRDLAEARDLIQAVVKGEYETQAECRRLGIAITSAKPEIVKCIDYLALLKGKEK